MNKTVVVSGIGTALPEFAYSPSEIVNATAGWLKDYPDKRALFDRFLSSSKTEKRSFILPVEEILALNGMSSRDKHFEREGPALGTRAVFEALQNSKLSPKDIDTFLFTSCSCPSIPSIDSLIMENIGVSRTANRIPVYQYGCAGGVAGLGIASKLAQAGQRVALNSVELCSLVFHPKNPSTAELVGSAIFGDGSACVVVEPGNEGLVIVGHESYLIPDSRHLMGYDLLDDGFHLRLSKDLPNSLTTIVPTRVGIFLEKYGVLNNDIGAWLFHPGSIKILEILENVLNVPSNKANLAREVLHDTGNLSSSTVLFVLDRYLKSRTLNHKEYAVMVGIGPGLTLELILFQFHGK